MVGERLKQIEEIYHTALEIQPAERESFFKKHCGEDADLRREVESLLSFEHSSDNFLETPPGSLVAEMFTEQDKQTDLIGKEIKHYKIMNLLGKGGMGEVYLAEDTNLNRQVALKFLPAELTGSIDRLKRFEREAQTASGLNHPNILTIHHFGTENDSRFIVTEFVEGVTLSKKMSSGRLAMSEMLDVAVQVAAALAAAHEAGIVHRDIKPDNIMIRGDGLVKVLDFGLAKLVEQSANIHQTDPEAKTRALVKTNPGAVMGTADYMSPEQARGLAVDARTDIFSFGVLLYEMLTGQKPFTGETINHTIVNIFEKETPSVFGLVKDCPAELEKIINKTLAKKPEERFQTAKELLSNLKKLHNRLEFEKELRRTSKPNLPDEAETQIYDTNDGDLPISTPNNLTKNSSPIIGREKEIAEISDLLTQENVRLLTMTGIGGTGKTRLVQAVAKRMLGEFTDGVFFVALASITDYKLVVSTIANTLGVKESGGVSVLESLKNHLRDKEILLVVDNFEQVIEAAPDIAELFEAGDKLKILITSRESLHLSAEREYDVLPLAVPAEEMQISLDELSNYEAVRFFVERAQFAQTDFKLTDENADAVAEICRRLDGLPLAIELAAARVKIFSPAAILNRLSDSLKLLTGGAKDLPERRQTMRGAIAWSYDLLDVDEKKMLNRLAVFRGGFSLDGAEKVAIEEKSAQAETQNTNSDIDIYDGISSLLDKSLIIRSDQKDSEPRFRMLVVVREFAAEKLSESGESKEIKRRHTDVYRALSEKAESEIYGAKSAEWCEKLEQEHDNIRAALRWALDNEPKIALQIALSNYLFWLRQGYLAEGCGWMTEALEKTGDDADPQMRADVLRKTADLFHRRGDSEAATSFGEEVLRLSRQAGNKRNISTSLSVLSSVKNAIGDFKQARKYAEEGLIIARELNHTRTIGILLNNLGEIARGEEDYQAARKYYEDALEISRQDSSVNSHYYMGNLASITYLLDDYQASRSYSLEVLKLQGEFGDKVIVAQSIGVLAAVAVKEGKPEKAARLAGAEAAIHETIGHKPNKTNQAFIDIYIKEICATIGDEAFEAGYANGRQLSLKEAIALAREGESDILSATHITDEANSKNTQILTNDALEAQTVIFDSTISTNPEVSRPNNFLSNIRRKQVLVAALVIILLTAGGFFGYRYFVTTENRIKSIAVLPFINQTGNADNEYLSDGLTDALINKLSQLPQLKVIARSSSFKFKGKEIETSEIAKTLGVQAIVTGRITQRGDTLQINVEMTDAAENTQIWGEQYNRKVSDALNVEEDIVQIVAEKLNLQLTGSQQQQIAKQATSNSQAYQFYLNGIFYRRSNIADNLKKAIEYQNQAIALDPNFALAYTEIALNYATLVEIGTINPADGKPKARAAAEKAVALDETLPEAHNTLAYIENQDLNWTAAEQNFKRAIELNSNYAAAHTLYASYLSQLGRTDEALSEIKIAQKLDPLRVGLIGNEGIILYYARRYAEAISKMQEGLKPEPENAPARVYLGRALAADEQYENAIREFQLADKTDDSSTDALIYLAQTETLSGKRGEAEEILNRLKMTDKYVSPAALAILYAALGDKEAAFKSLEKAYAERDLNLQYLKVEPAYDLLREDSRFQEWLQKVGFPR